MGADRRTRAGASLRAREKPSIAVLPFDNMSGGSEQEHLDDGLTEEIITPLAKHRSLSGIAIGASLGYSSLAGRNQWNAA